MTSDTSTRSDHVAELVRFLRLQRGWTADDLAQRCAEAGYPAITRAVIANIETGRRDDGRRRRGVSVDELVAFADVLGIPAGNLLFGEITITVAEDGG